GKVYRRGFGLNADFYLFGQQILLDLIMEEKGVSQKRFYGKAELVNSIDIGGILKICRSSSEPSKGPMLMVSSYTDATRKFYVYMSAKVVLLDIISAELSGEASDDGFRYLYKLGAGDQRDGGAWIGSEIAVMLSRRSE